jgi:hypothetical protein
MGLFDEIFSKKDFGESGIIPTGKQKKDGSHDHRTNTGNDRTPAQKEGDKKKTKLDTKF